jgi:hypothetical protein
LNEKRKEEIKTLPRLTSFPIAGVTHYEGAAGAIVVKGDCAVGVSGGDAAVHVVISVGVGKTQPVHHAEEAEVGIDPGNGGAVGVTLQSN